MVQKIDEKRTLSDVLGDFLLKHRKVIVGVFSVLVVSAVVFAAVAVGNEKNTAKGLDKVDSISYELTNKSDDLDEAGIAERQDKALNALSEYTAKGGIVGVRANMLAAEIYFQKKDYSSAGSAWLSAAAKGKKSYTAPLALFNAAVCFEELGDLDKAAENYKSAAETEEFFEASHARFSLGRVQEAKQDYSSAVSSYKALVEKSPDDAWAKLAKSRLIELKNSGKAE